jgi:hypothetical protein
MNPFDAYEAALQAPRDSFAAGGGFARVMQPTVDPELLELFLIHFSALGVGMTEPVDRWIRGAGERCTAIGLAELGRVLGLHAGHEAGHHELMIEDTKKLVARWNARHAAAPLSADALIRQPEPASVARYRRLHEETIASDHPYGQLAIEYEIERLSVTHGAALIRHCVERLGREVVAGLSFLEEHVAVDAGHTNFNAAQLEKLLGEHPDFLPPLVDTGTAALAAYRGFLDECCAQADAVRQRPASS